MILDEISVVSTVKLFYLQSLDRYYVFALQSRLTKNCIVNWLGNDA
jgi:hypothetical protein